MILEVFQSSMNERVLKNLKPWRTFSPDMAPYLSCERLLAEYRYLQFPKAQIESQVLCIRYTGFNVRWFRKNRTKNIISYMPHFLTLRQVHKMGPFVCVKVSSLDHEQKKSFMEILVFRDFGVLSYLLHSVQFYNVRAKTIN